MKILISCAPDHRMKQNLVDGSYVLIYITEPVYALIDSKLNIWQMLAHMCIKAIWCLYIAMTYLSDGL